MPHSSGLDGPLDYSAGSRWSMPLYLMCGEMSLAKWVSRALRLADPDWRRSTFALHLTFSDRRRLNQESSLRQSTISSFLRQACQSILRPVNTARQSSSISLPIAGPFDLKSVFPSRSKSSMSTYTQPSTCSPPTKLFIREIPPAARTCSDRSRHT